MSSVPGSRLCLTALLLLGSTTGASTVVAQSAPNPRPRDRVWVSGGFGSGRTGGGPLGAVGLASGLSITYQPGPVLFTTRIAGVWNFLQGDLVGDVGLLVGLGTRGRRSHASISVGPALTGGNLRTFWGDSTSFSSRLGAAFQVQVLALPFTTMGVGITGFANLNSHQSFGGLMISFAVGQVR